MKITAFCEEAEIIQKIFKNVSLWESPKRMSPGVGTDPE
jgi:hypothetical protein